MILFSLGTHSQDFSRMAKAADDFAATTNERVVVQTGYTHYDFKNVTEHFDFCPKDKMQKLMDEAGILVLQGGWGGICEAVDKGKRVVVIPRINGPEHIHDQGQVVRKMESLGCLIGVYPDGDVPTDGSARLTPEIIASTSRNLQKAVEKAKTFDFKPLRRGSARIVADTLLKWFYNDKNN